MEALVGLGSAIAAVWLLILIAIIRARRRGEKLAELARLIPDLARLLIRLWRDKTIPRRVRARILIAIAYNVQPINLIPDFVPVIGLADNLVITLWVLRSTVRHAGQEAIITHWPGTPEGLATIFRLARLERHAEP
jgi:uncharacterized membrane protein YkvA (DUF1232 family)